MSGRNAGRALQAQAKGKQEHRGQSEQPGRTAESPWSQGFPLPSVERGEEKAPHLLPWPMDFQLLSINRSWADSVHGKKNIIQDKLTVQITCPSHFNKNKCSGMHSSSNWKTPRNVNMLTSGRPSSHALMSCRCLGTSMYYRVQDCTLQWCMWAQYMQLGEEPQQGVMENCPGCVSSLHEYKDTNILLGITVYILSVGFFSVCSMQHICSSLGTDFLIIVIVPGNF